MMEVSPQRLKEELAKDSGFLLVDIQDAHEYAHSHIKGAINIPFSEWEKEAYSLLRDTTQVIVLYEAYDELGGVLTLAKQLEANGFSKIGRLTGGLKAWQNAGFITDGGMES